MKIYIDHNLTTRALDGEWPEVPEVKVSIYAETFAMQKYEKALEQAKSDSVPLIGHTFWEPIEPETFIEADIEVEFVKQNQWVHRGWLDDDEFNPPNAMVVGHRIIARVKSKPVEMSKFEKAIKEAAEINTILTPEVMKQIQKDVNTWSDGDYAYSCTNTGAFIEGAKHQYPIAFEAGKKARGIASIRMLMDRLDVSMFSGEAWNYLCNVTDIIYDELDKLKK